VQVQEDEMRGGMSQAFPRNSEARLSILQSHNSGPPWIRRLGQFDGLHGRSTDAPIPADLDKRDSGPRGI
jgi:hypothetical protein